MATQYSYSADWSDTATLPGEVVCEQFHGKQVCLANDNRANILNLDSEQLEEAVNNGAKHVLNYPVDVTRLRLPKEAMEKFFNSDSRSALRRFIYKVAQRITKFKSFDDIFNWLGLHKFPKQPQEHGPNLIAKMGAFEKYHMGVSHFERNSSSSFSFSCAACHSADLFGTKIIGLTNRFSKANEAFILGKSLLSKTPAFMFNMLVGPSDEDMNTFEIAKAAMEYVTTKKPLALGLDTSLAQVGLSLSMRAQDEYASKRKYVKARKNPLSHIPADSKPAVWWNLKYKTKWLSDGSIVSGNPVHTNFLWNEIGRGVDLKELEQWLIDNQSKVDELTAYVFNTKAPRFNDYFPNKIQIPRAIEGQKLFIQNCKGCHGDYKKGWNSHTAGVLNYNELISTEEVWYHQKTKTINVGTDPHRAQGMRYFYKDLNRLKISKSIGTVVEPQMGYVPPPLVGIWARWPYFHNNSVPTLYDVLTPSELRPKSYIAVPSKSRNTDFDSIKNGYPRPSNIREPYRSDKDYFYNTKIKGLSNAGHSKMMRNEDGSEKFSHMQKLQIIEFLKTL